MKLLHTFSLLAWVALATACADSGSSGGQEDPDPVDYSAYIWNKNSLHFAKLRDAVHTCDYAEGGFSDLRFDERGYLVGYRFTGYDAAGTVLDEQLHCTYDGQGRIESVAASAISVRLTYGTHERFVEVAADIFEQNNAEFLWLCRPRFVQGLKALEFTVAGERHTFTFRMTADGMEVLDRDGQVWSSCTYDGVLPAIRTTRYDGFTYDDDGNRVAYEGTYTECFAFNRQNGALLREEQNEHRIYADGSEEDLPYAITYFDDTYNNVATDGIWVYTYDAYGDYLTVVAGQNSDEYSYTRDGHGNWTERIDMSTFMGGEPFEIREQRQLTYY